MITDRGQMMPIIRSRRQTVHHHGRSGSPPPEDPGTAKPAGGLVLFEHAAGDGWWLAPGEDPAGEGSGDGNAENCDGEV